MAITIEITITTGQVAIERGPNGRPVLRVRVPASDMRVPIGDVRVVGDDGLTIGRMKFLMLGRRQSVSLEP